MVGETGQTEGCDAHSTRASMLPRVECHNKGTDQQFWSVMVNFMCLFDLVKGCLESW